MRLTQTEKMEIIRLVDGSEIGATKTLQQLGIHKSTFYKWYHHYQDNGIDGLAPKPSKRRQVWNRIPQEVRDKVKEIALDKEDYSPRELAFHIIDTEGYHISESSVYRILRECGLMTAPAYIVLSAADSFKKKTTHPNEMWQTDFTYFNIIGWGWYYLSTVIDDYSRFIVAWELCDGMKATDVQRSINLAMRNANLSPNQRPVLLSDNGSCYIAGELKNFLKDKGIKHIHGRVCHPQTQVKIERYNRTLKNKIKLEHYYIPEELKQAIEKFVEHYNYKRYHESIHNCTPADVFTGKYAAVLARRKQIKQRTLERRKKQYMKTKVQRE